MFFRKTHQKGAFRFLDRRCIGATCWAPGSFQHRGATSSGSRSTGASSLCCLTNAYRGCPDEDKRGYDDALVRLRRGEGWRAK